ncbi:MAG: DUF6444 domain-containing protein [Chloroflexi bacterium]|nr:DUF6444 domain-containing protein [Chloroflexota bacterium]
MPPIDEILPANLLEALPVSAEDWEQTPKSVQALVVGLLTRLQALEIDVSRLREQVNRISGNSSQPPSSDNPGVVKPPKKKQHSGRNRGGQAGHPGTNRKLVAAEELKAAHDIKPATCRCCGENLSGEDSHLYRHQVAEVPPVKIEVTEYRLHTLNCATCRTATRAKLPEGVPQGGFGPRFQSMVSILSGKLLRQGSSCSHCATAGTCRNILKREVALWTFVDVDGVEPTNNHAEQKIRPGVLWRNGSFGTQSEAGSRFIERIMTVVSTLKQQKRNLLDYLTRLVKQSIMGTPRLLFCLHQLSDGVAMFHPVNEYKNSTFAELVLKLVKEYYQKHEAIDYSIPSLATQIPAYKVTSLMAQIRSEFCFE